jgi:ADP-ribose pyrophosphatase YjhB (NUDIX family)
MRELVVRALIPVDEKLLLVKHKAEQDFWVLPGGRVDDQEGIRDALKRELVEELGVAPEIGNLLYVYQLQRGDTERVEFHFHVINGADYTNATIGDGSHSEDELADLAFQDPREVKILPSFIASDYTRLLSSGFNVGVRFIQT